MGERFFDDLARTLAQPMPRRRLLRLLGGAIAVAAVPALRPARARGAPTVTGPPEQEIYGPIPCGETAFGPQICQSTNCVKCCHGPGGPVSCCPCYFTCSPAGLCTTPVTGCAPDGRPFCGGDGVCCNPEEVCYRGSICVPVCEAGETLCGGDCCPRGFDCVRQSLGGSAPREICLPKCPRRRVRCGLGCCPAGHKCLNPRLGTCAQCDPGRQPCGKKCCPAGMTCCDPRTGLCCRKQSETCAGYGGRAKCCPRGTRACEERPGSGRIVCCPRGETCARVGDASGTIPVGGDNRFACCPESRVVDFGGDAVCCPDGYTSLGGRFVLPPFGGGGFCCRDDKLCGDTCCGTNADPVLDSTCCNGACVSLAFDPANCGSCGRQCAPGERCAGGACVPA